MQDLYQRYLKHRVACPGLGIEVDPSRLDFGDDFWSDMKPRMETAFDAMDRLEGGAIANPDEGRMVGHYWLRDPERAPDPQTAQWIRDVLQQVKRFAAAVHDAEIKPPDKKKFTDVLQVGIGGSALGPQLVADCLGARRDKLRIHFLDNTDPDGILRTLDSLGARLKSTLVLVVSKSGGTPEARNGMEETRANFDRKGLDFSKHAVAVTGVDSKLDRVAREGGWLERFPMEDWVGGRTSVMSAVGLLPAALQGVDIDAFLDGAAKMDELTRQHDAKKNPAAMLAAMWYFATNGRGEKDMVILPYKDRLVLLSRYLQQLVMESLGKEKDREGNVVHQGIAVYGNKGSTDQHAYVQQLREGLNNFFATFFVVLQDVPRRDRKRTIEVEDSATSGDFLYGFWLGTQRALHEAGRGSITVTLDRLDAKTLGALIALYERAVGLYAELIDVNAYHQPGVEAGKKAAAAVIDLQSRLIEAVRNEPEATRTAEEWAQHIGRAEDAETALHLLRHLAANGRYVKRRGKRFTALA